MTPGTSEYQIDAVKRLAHNKGRVTVLAAHKQTSAFFLAVRRRTFVHTIHTVHAKQMLRNWVCAACTSERNENKRKKLKMPAQIVCAAVGTSVGDEPMTRSTPDVEANTANVRRIISHESSLGLHRSVRKGTTENSNSARQKASRWGESISIKFSLTTDVGRRIEGNKATCPRGGTGQLTQVCGKVRAGDSIPCPVIAFSPRNGVGDRESHRAIGGE
jgi:hypothetical protein